MHLFISKWLRKQKSRQKRKTMRQRGRNERRNCQQKCFHSFKYVIDHVSIHFFFYVNSLCCQAKHGSGTFLGSMCLPVCPKKVWKCHCLLYVNFRPEDVKCNIAIYANDNTLYFKCDQASDLWQQLEWASELESDLQDIVDWGRNWIGDFSAGKTQLVLVDQSNNVLLVLLM